MATGWAGEPRLLSRHEVAELCVRRSLDAELLSDETGHVASGDGEGVALFAPVASIDGDELYEVHEL